MYKKHKCSTTPMSMVSDKKIKNFIFTDEMVSKNHLTAALAYCQYFPVFPVWGVKKCKCLCGRKNCSSPGKHPILKDGYKGASTNESQIRKWWEQYPEANIGSQLVKGLYALDFDGETGQQTLLKLNIRQKTLKAITGKGCHLYFLADLDVRNGALPGLDIRGGGDDGYIILPPSRHVLGKRYKWEV